MNTIRSFLKSNGAGGRGGRRGGDDTDGQDHLKVFMEVDQKRGFHVEQCRNRIKTNRERQEKKDMGEAKWCTLQKLAYRVIAERKMDWPEV